MRYFLAFIFVLGLGRVSFAGGTSLEILEEINLARTNPQHYAQLIAGSRLADPRSVAEAVSFLQKARPLPPLAFVDGLALSAQRHVADQGSRGAIGHSGSNHSSPWSRMAEYGRYVGRAGENISYGCSDARNIVAQLIIDQGVPGRGHRKNIFSPSFAVAGAACGHHARYGAMCVIDFAGGFEEKGGAFAWSGASRFGGPSL
jgi:uncharacterized protein YkwD